MEITTGDFVTTDGTRIHFDGSGAGPAIVACNGFGVSTFFWKYLRALLGPEVRFITWDYRGHGESANPSVASTMNIKCLSDDLYELMEHLKLDNAVFLGHSMGTMVMLQFYLDHPERVRALIPVLGTFGRPLDTFANFKYSLPLFNAFFKIGSTFPRGTHSTLSKLLNPRFAVPAAMMFGVVDWLRCPAGDVKEYIEHLVARDLSLLLILARDMADRSLKHVLPQIKVPTLIFAGGLDAFAPPQIAGEMRSLIPGNEFVCVDGGTHVALVEHPEVLATAVSRFLKSNGIC